MNWYKLYKLASVDFAPQGWMFDDRNETLLDLCYGALYILYEKYKEINHTMIQPDGDDFDKPTGTINLYVPIFIPEVIPELIEDAKNALRKLDVEVDDNVQIETYQDYIDKHNYTPEQQSQLLRENQKASDPRVARIVVTRNHNVEALEMKKLFGLDAPPTINMTASNAQRLLSMLEFDIVDQNYPIEAQKIKEKIEEVLPKVPQDDEYAIRRLNDLKQLAEWCIKHGYSKITHG